MMEQQERLDFMLGLLIAERGDEIAIPEGNANKRALYRALVNVRPPKPAPEGFLPVQDAFLQEEARRKGIVTLEDIPPCPVNPRVSLWRGDITRLRVDAIVNAANSTLMGCFVPGHGCIDNAIHTAAGVQLREECAALMRRQGRPEGTGQAKLTKAYNLPSQFVLHTVGPIVRGELTDKHRAQLARSYRSCLELAEREGLKSVALCCVSTGEFCFPNREAAEIAVSAVRDFLARNLSTRVVFCVFKEVDETIYRGLLR